MISRKGFLKSVAAVAAGLVAAKEVKPIEAKPEPDPAPVVQDIPQVRINSDGSTTELAPLRIVTPTIPESVTTWPVDRWYTPSTRIEFIVCPDGSKVLAKRLWNHDRGQYDFHLDTYVNLQERGFSLAEIAEIGRDGVRSYEDWKRIRELRGETK